MRDELFLAKKATDTDCQCATVDQNTFQMLSILSNQTLLPYPYIQNKLCLPKRCHAQFRFSHHYQITMKHKCLTYGHWFAPLNQSLSFPFAIEK